MSKRTKLTAMALAAVLTLTVGLTTFVLAQEPPEDEGNTAESPGQTFTNRVAGILGIEEEELVDAFRQAREEMREGAVDRCLQWAIENECIDEGEADKIREWREDLPDRLRDFGRRIRLHLEDAWGDRELSWPMPCR